MAAAVVAAARRSGGSGRRVEEVATWRLHTATALRLLLLLSLHATQHSDMKRWLSPDCSPTAGACRCSRDDLVALCDEVIHHLIQVGDGVDGGGERGVRLRVPVHDEAPLPLRSSERRAQCR